MKKLKKLNKNIFVFVFAMLFILLGFTRNYLSLMFTATKSFDYGIIHGNSSSVEKFEKSVDGLRYHDTLMDINSIKENLVGTRIVKKDDSTIVKSDNGSLFSPGKKMSQSEIDDVVLKIEALKDVSEKNGAEFLYCAAPSKANYINAPQNVTNNSKDNYDLFLTTLSQKVECLDFSECFDKNNIPDDDIYFFTDHHWKPYSGFVAYKSICEKLNQSYGFEYNKDYTDITNFNIKKYENLFLGSYGKKVGTYFSFKGADDFDLITPKFDTDFTEEQPFKNEVKSGSFENTLLFTENLKKDYYNINSYSTYSGGDFRLQIMKNNLSNNGKKVLLIRDSFACVTAPFLALQTSELHICDMRDYEYYVGNKLNMEEYIQKIKPDYVLVLYSDIYSLINSNGKYDFF